MTDRSSPAGSHRASCGQTTSPSTSSRASPRPAGSISRAARIRSLRGREEEEVAKLAAHIPETIRVQEAEVGAEQRRLGSTPSSSAPFPRAHPISTGRWSVPSKPSGSDSMRPRTWLIPISPCASRNGSSPTAGAGPVGDHHDQRLTRLAIGVPQDPRWVSATQARLSRLSQHIIPKGQKRCIT
jgi:hypothetical protein